MRSACVILCAGFLAGAVQAQQAPPSWGPSLYGPYQAPAQPPAAAPPSTPAQPERTPERAKLAPRRPGARQEIVTMPPPPPVDTHFRPAPPPVPQPSPLSPGVPPPPMPAVCDASGCATPSGQRLNGQGKTLLDAAGHACVRNGPVIQCF